MLQRQILVIRLINVLTSCMALHEKCPYLELFWSVFSRIRSEGSLRIRENTDQNKSECEHFLHSENPKKPSNIDSVLTNEPHSFQNSCVIKTGLSYRVFIRLY